MPSPRFLWLLLVLAVSTSGSQLQAQRVGDRVRVSASGTTYVGQVTAVSDERLELYEGTRAWSIAFSGMSRLERSTGTRSQWREGLVYGAAVGAVGGVIIGVLVGGTCELVTLGEEDRVQLPRFRPRVGRDGGLGLAFGVRIRF